MSFFLLGKSGTEKIYLVSDSAFPTRAAALKELGAITSDPSFAGWDDEILVVDESVTSPVLLVRPAGAAGSASGADEPAEESLKGALLRSTVQMEAEGIEAPESFELSDDESGAVETESDEREELEDVQESESVVAVETDQAEAPSSWPWDKDTSEHEGFGLDALEEPGDDEGSLVRAPGDDDTMAFAKPVIMGAYGDGSATPPVDEVITDAAEPDAESDLLASTDGELAVDVEEDRANDLEDEVPADDSESESPNTDVAVEPIPSSSDFVDLSGAIAPDPEPTDADAEVESTSAEPEPEVVAEPEPEVVAEPEPEVVAEPEPEVELELEPEVVAEPEPEVVAEPDPALIPADAVETIDDPPAVVPPIAAMTCNDCVYVETCPNKGQLAPESCGSFQWK